MPNATINNHEEDHNNNEHMNNHEDQNNNTELENNQEDQRINNVNPVRCTRRAIVNYNCARDFNEGWGVPFCRLPTLRTCPYCNARLFHRETLNLCCSKGNIVLPLIPSLPEMIQLFSDQTDVGRKFRQNIRAYNNVFAFTSMGVHVDESINVQGRGIYTFRAQGSIYHKIGGLLPSEGARPRYLQGYIYDTDPTVDRLQIHLPNMQQIRFDADEAIEDILADEHAQKSMLTEYFTMNRMDSDARRYLYREFPQYYRWDSKYKAWVKRRNNYKVIGRIYSVSPSEGEKFYLRVLLNHIRGPRSFRDLLTINGVLQPTFKQAAEKLGLLEDDNSIRQCLLEASAIRMPSALRRLFVTILVYSQPTGVRRLWDEFYPFMIEDYSSSSDIVDSSVINRLLRDLNRMLEQFNKSTREFDLPEMTSEPEDSLGMPRCIEDKISISIPQEDIDAIDHLNNDQMVAFNTIMAAAEGREGALFFIDGPEVLGRPTYIVHC